MIDFVKVGKRIADLRRSFGLSQDELAEKLFVTRQAVSKWENGMSVPSIDILSDICRMFSVSFEELLGLFDKERLVLDPDDIFRGHDRSFIVSKIAKGEIKVDLAAVFYQMSPAERSLHVFLLSLSVPGESFCGQVKCRKLDLFF